MQQGLGAAWTPAMGGGMADFWSIVECHERAAYDGRKTAAEGTGHDDKARFRCQARSKDWSDVAALILIP